MARRHPLIVILVYYATALLTLIALGLALSGSPRSLWIAALASWILSFLGSFSIGSYTLVLTFALVSTAVGNRTGWIKTLPHQVLAVLAGVALWFIAIKTLDDFWLFFPLSTIGLLLP